LQYLHPNKKNHRHLDVFPNTLSAQMNHFF
jgi:hypothetical protein